MKYSYTAIQGSSGIGQYHFRIAAPNDDAVAFSYIENNARLVVELMNKGMAADELLAFARSVADDKLDRASPGLRAYASQLVAKAEGRP